MLGELRLCECPRCGRMHNHLGTPPGARDDFAQLRRAAIEECARVAEQYSGLYGPDGKPSKDAVKYIRALAQQPPAGEKK